MAIDDERLRVLASISPLRALELRQEEEEKRQGGERYKLLYEKTYSSGNIDSYESSVAAHSLEEALARATAKLQRKDMMATWSTNITDALLIDPRGNEHFVPQYSKKWRERKEEKNK